MRRHRHSSRRRHDPAGFASRGIVGKLVEGVEVYLGGLLGGLGGNYVKAAVPQANVQVTSTKGINLVDAALSVGLGGFGPKSGHVGRVLQGVAGGLGAASDPFTGAVSGSQAPSMRQVGTLGV